jgi:integration host factor subunit beta
MTKSDLIERLAAQLRLPKGKAEAIVNTVFDAMEGALARGERIEIRGLGSFEVRSYKAYEGRNPRTGSPVEVQQKKLPFFKVGKELKERVNASRHATETSSDQQSGSVSSNVPPPVASSSSSS